ncbi:MAG: 2-amino-4-hydroxy-6-hydroxymethyldihydropteridine diphosphokinase [Planctomycetota bacterium]
MHTAAIGLGANVSSAAGPPAETLQAAVRFLGVQARIAAASSLFVTVPVGPANQPDYANAAVLLQTALWPADLLGVLLAVERRFGRDRRKEQRWGPRTLDLDLLLFEGVVLETPSLTLPHPRLHERSFVLDPLAEIAGDMVVPGHGRTVRELRSALAETGG